MRQIHFVGGEKGGVGKSVMSRVLAQYYIDHQLAFKVYDADLSHGAMMRYYTDFSEAVDIAAYGQADALIENFMDSELDLIVDLPAQTHKNLSAWISETGLLALSQELKINLIFWHVMDDGSDSYHLLASLFETYGNQANYILVKNYGRGQDFSHIDAWLEKIDQTQFRYKILELPALNGHAMRKIDHQDASFWAAANYQQKPALGLMERQRVKIWLNKAYQQLQQTGLF